MQIKGKVALITGGAIRVGKAITLMLAQNGADVVVNYFSSSKAALETVAEAQAYGVRALAVQCDVSDPIEVQRMADTVLHEFGGVDIIVNSAGLFEQMPFPTDNYETWHRVTGISIDGPFYVCNTLTPSMLAGWWGNRQYRRSLGLGAVAQFCGACGEQSCAFGLYAPTRFGTCPNGTGQRRSPRSCTAPAGL